MKLEAQRFEAGKLILKQSLPAFAPAWLRLWERAESEIRSFRFYPGPLSTALIKSNKRSCNVKGRVQAYNFGNFNYEIRVEGAGQDTSRLF